MQFQCCQDASMVIIGADGQFPAPRRRRPTPRSAEKTGKIASQARQRGDKHQSMRPPAGLIRASRESGRVRMSRIIRSHRYRPAPAKRVHLMVRLLLFRYGDRY
jgi:hypothetical protein